MSLTHDQIKRLQEYEFVAPVVITQYDLIALEEIGSEWAYKLKVMKADIPPPADEIDLDLTDSKLTRVDLFRVDCYNEGFYPKRVLAQVVEDINSKLWWPNFLNGLRFEDWTRQQLKHLKSKIKVRL